MNDLPTVLVLTDYFLPGYKAGGPIRSLSALVAALKNDFRFRVVTRDRDIDDRNAYPGVDSDVWRAVGETDVLYLSPGNLSLGTLRRILHSENPDVLYLNSFFSPGFSIRPLLLRRLGLIPRIPVILAPRGEFSRGALAIKEYKKRVFLLVSSLIGLHRGVTWHASSVYEEEDIRRRIAGDVRVIVAPVLSPNTGNEIGTRTSRGKAAGSLKLVFLSRISRMKNLDFSLNALKDLEGDVSFSIYGPMEDPAYWAECQNLIRSLPSNIQVQYMGDIPYNRVSGIFREHDIFFFPTLGENFGHVILESLSSGCPVLTSDRTPWRHLEEKGVGWDFPLERPDLFRDALQLALAMDDEILGEWSRRARQYAVRYCSDGDSIQRNRSMFLTLLSVPGTPVATGI